MPAKKRPRPVDPIKRIRQAIERERKKAKRKGLKFVAPSDEELRKKLGRVNSPMIVSEGWGDAPAGGTVSYTVGISNPDAFDWSSLYVHVFVGPANPVGSVSGALKCVDAKFPRLTQPDFFGLSIAAGDTEQLNFQIPIPAGTVPGVYLGNAFLFKATYTDVGTYYDRGCFPFEVT